MHITHKRLVFAVGAAMVLAGLAWGALGVALVQVVWLVALLAAGSLVMWLASRMPAAPAGHSASSPVTIERGHGDTGPRRPIGERVAAAQFSTSTTKTFSEVVQLGRAIAEAAGGVANTVREADLVQDQRVVYKVRRLGVRTVLTFAVHVTEGDVPGRTVVGLQVGDYLTTQAKVLGIRVGPRSAPGYDSLRTFSASLQRSLDDHVPVAASAPPPPPPSATVTAAAPTAETAPPDSAAGGRRPWRVAAVAGGCVVLFAGVATAIHLAREDDGTDTALPEDTSAPTTGSPVDATAGARLHGVLDLDPTVVDGCDGRTGDDALLLPSANRTICFRLGPAIAQFDERTSFSPVTDGFPGVWVILPSDDAATLAEYTADNFGGSLAVVVDDVVVSSPPVHGGIADGRLFIEVADEQQEAQLLAQLQGG